MLSIDQTQFLNQYKKILHKTINIIPHMVLIMISIFVVFSITNQIDIQNDKAIQTNIHIIKNAMQNYYETQSLPDGAIIAQQGGLYVSGNHIQSSNNLIKIKGFILPQKAAIISSQAIKNQSYFQETYNIDELRAQVQTIINPGSNILTKNKQTLINLPHTSLYRSFELECIDAAILSPLCRKRINNFINVFYTFDIHKNIDELVDIFTKIKQKKQICDNILQYALYNNFFHQQLEYIIDSCEQGIQDKYINHKHLYTINMELTNANYTNTIYTNKDLNAYKLLSLIQQIFQDIQNDNIQTRRIESYINYLQELMRKQGIENIYRDIVYRFTNYTIIPHIQQNITKSANYTMLNNQLISINRENNLLQYSGLQNMITNKDLIQSGSIYITTLDSSMSGMVYGLNNLPYITITQENFDEKTAYLTGEMALMHPIQGALTITFYIQAEKYINRLIVREIIMTDYPLLTNIINIFLENRNITIPTLYGYINDNIGLYSNPSYIELCDQIENIIDFSINICNTSLIQGIKTINSTNITYKIHIENNNITYIETSEPNRTEYLGKKYNNTASDAIRLPGLIQEILNIQVPSAESDNKTRSQDNIIQIANIFEALFKTKPIEIVKYGNTYYIEFRIDAINFVLAYNNQNNISGPLYFRNVTIYNRPLRLENRSIPLTTEYASMIQKFSNNPLQYIQENEPFIYESYLQFK